MARDYARVTPSFWTGETARSLLRGDPTMTTVAVYLITCTHANMIGVYYLPTAYIETDTGLCGEDVGRCLDALETHGFVVRDRASDWVFVVEAARIQIGTALKATDKQVKGIGRELDRCPASMALAFLDRYADAYHLDRSPFEAPSKPLRTMCEAPPKPGAGTGAGTSTGSSNAQEAPWDGGRIASPSDFGSAVASWGWALPTDLRGSVRAEAKRILDAGPIAEHEWEAAKAAAEKKIAKASKRPAYFLGVVSGEREDAAAIARLGPGAQPAPHREPYSPFEHATKAAMRWAVEEDAKDEAAGISRGNDKTTRLLPAKGRG